MVRDCHARPSPRENPLFLVCGPWPPHRGRTFSVLILATGMDFLTFPVMQTIAYKKLTAVEKQHAELSGLGKHVRKPEKDLAGLSMRLEAPKNWRNAVGTLADTKLSREADAMGRQIRSKQTKP